MFAMAALVNTSAAISMATMMISELSSVVFAWIFGIPIGSVIITRKPTTRQLRRLTTETQQSVRKEHAVTNNDKSEKQSALSVALLPVQQIRHNLRWS